MSNVYGFDFLKNQHTLTGTENDVDPTLHSANIPQTAFHDITSAAVEDPPPPSVANKSDLEKQFDVIQFLHAHRSSGCLPPSIIYKSIGIDLSDGGSDEAVTKMLVKNAKIRVEEIPDPENPSLTIYTFGYMAKFNNVHNKVGLLAQINRCKNGVKRNDLMDAYEGVERDLESLVTAGDIVAVANSEDKDVILFPRGEAFLVELDGNVVLPPDVSKLLGKKDGLELGHVPTNMTTDGNGLFKPKRRCFIVETDVDPRRQVRRGEAVCVGGQWFRVSSAVKEGSLADQPARAQAPKTVSLRKDLSKKNEVVEGYIRPFDEKQLPLDHDLTPVAMKNINDAKDAREKLFKIAGGRGVTGGASAQLLSSNASSANPEVLAAAFASSAASGAGSTRRRPAGMRNTNMHHGSLKAAAAGQMDQAKKAASDPSLVYCHARRHGCTVDVRDMYLATRTQVPESEVDLFQLMVEYKLLEPNEQMRQPRMKIRNKNLGEDGKPKKRRYYEKRGQRNTNTHLNGTAIGAALAFAQEKQQQGKSVGDGGM